MADDVTIKDAADVVVPIRTLDNGAGKEIQVFQQSIAGATGSESLVSASNPLPAYFPNTPTFTVSGAVAVTGTFYPATQPVSGTFWQTTQPVSIASMPTTPVTGTFWQATQPVSGTFWQSTQPVSIASMPSTPVTGTFWQATQPVSLSAVPLPTGAASEAGNLATIATQTAGLLTVADFDTKSGALTETAPTTDTASSGINGRLQRIAQRLTSLIALLPAALGAGGGLKVDGSGTALPVSGTITANAGTNLNTSALALETGGNLATVVTNTGRIPAQGQALAASSTPVVLPAAQITTLTPPAAITGFATAVKQPALGTAGTASADVLSVQGIASMTPLAVGGTTLTINSSLTRPANTTAYSANQVISNATSGGTYQTFANAARVSAGSGVIVGVNLLDEVNATTPVQPILYLFNAAPATALNDGAALALSNADGILLIAAIPLVASYLLNASASPNGARYFTAQGLNIGFKCASGTSLYGVLAAGAAYTPVSGEVLVTQLQIVQD